MYESTRMHEKHSNHIRLRNCEYVRLSVEGPVLLFFSKYIPIGVFIASAMLLFHASFSIPSSCRTLEVMNRTWSKSVTPKRGKTLQQTVGRIVQGIYPCTESKRTETQSKQTSCSESSSKIAHV